MPGGPQSAGTASCAWLARGSRPPQELPRNTAPHFSPSRAPDDPEALELREVGKPSRCSEGSGSGAKDAQVPGGSPDPSWGAGNVWAGPDTSPSGAWGGLGCFLELPWETDRSAQSDVPWSWHPRDLQNLGLGQVPPLTAQDASLMPKRGCYWP